MKALIMAGGKGSRLGSICEKPLVKICGIPLIDHIIEVLESHSMIDGVHIAVSPHTQETKRHIKCHHGNCEIIDTPGRGYHGDLRLAVSSAAAHQPVLIVPSDIMFLDQRLLTDIIQTYDKEKKPALSVFVESIFSIGASTPPFTLGKRKVVASGISIIDGAAIGEESIDQFDYIIQSKTDLLNINTAEEICIAERITSGIDK